MNLQSINRSTLLFASLLTLILVGCQSNQNSYTLSGSIKGLEDGTVLRIHDSGQDYKQIDSIVVVDGTIHKNGTSDPLAVYTIRVDQPRLFLNLFIEPGTISISGDASFDNSVRIKGTPANDLMSAYLDSLEPRKEAYRTYRKNLVELKDAAAKSKAYEDYKLQLTKLKSQDDFTKEFVKNYPDNLAVLSIFQNISPSYYNISFEDGLSLLTNMSDRLKQAPLYQNYKSSYDKLALVSINSKAPNFSGLDPNGKQMSLEASMGSKLTLIDFWASWCKPCRYEYPKLKKVYAMYKDQGFEIVGVSLDESNDKWVKAIEEEDIHWPQISNLKGFKDPIADTYQVLAIPSYLLIDENGIIVSKGRELRNNMREHIEKFIQ